MPYLTYGGHSTSASEVAVTRMSVLYLISFRCYIFVFTIDQHVYMCAEDSSAEGTCFCVKNRYFLYKRIYDCSWKSCNACAIMH